MDEKVPLDTKEIMKKKCSKFSWKRRAKKKKKKPTGRKRKHTHTHTHTHTFTKQLQCL